MYLLALFLSLQYYKHGSLSTGPILMDLFSHPWMYWAVTYGELYSQYSYNRL